MQELVTDVDLRIDIILNDGVIIPLKLDSLGNNNFVNYILSVNVNESLNAINNNPVGVVSSNTLKLDLKSTDKSLFPDNSGSTYYGRMDDSAVIKLYVIESGEELEFGTFFVSKWYSAVSSTTPFKVIIEATDLFSILSKNTVPSVSVKDDSDIKSYFIACLNALNEKNVEKFRVNFSDKDILFTRFPYMQFSNLDTASFGQMCNMLSQSTLTNIYLNRGNYLKTDYCCDDRVSESVCKLSDKINLVSVKADTGGLVNYSKVKVTYSEGVINATQQISSLQGQTLVKGDNVFNSIKLAPNMFKLDYIDVRTDDVTNVSINSVKYNKDFLSLVLNAPNDTVCDITVYGRVVQNSNLFLEVGDDGNGATLNVNNLLLINKGYVTLFANELLRLMVLKNRNIEVTGWINPRIKLGDIIELDADATIGVTGFYKVTHLNWFFNSTLKCSVKLLKVTPSIKNFLHK